MRRVGGAVLVLAVALAACGGNEKEPSAVRRAATTAPSTSTSTSTSTTTTTLPPPPDFSATMSGDSTAAAAAIAAAERATLDPATPPDVLHAAGNALQMGYRRIAASDPAVEAAVTAALPEDLRVPLARNVAAMRELLSLGKSSAVAPPAAWKIVPVAPVDELLGYYKKASAATNVPWEVLAAIHLVETKLGRVVGDSSAGAQGPMQFMPRTWAAYGQGDIYSNHDSIMSAAGYLKANGAPERMDDALYRYNPTSKYVNAIKHYATRLTIDPNSYRGYHQWQVIYRTKTGNLLLPEGWPQNPAIPLNL